MSIRLTYQHSHSYQLVSFDDKRRRESSDVFVTFLVENGSDQSNSTYVVVQLEKKIIAHAHSFLREWVRPIISMSRVQPLIVDNLKI